MTNRASHGLPGVSEAEFQQWNAWFHANRDDLPMHYKVAEDGTTEPRNTCNETVLFIGTRSDHAFNAMQTLREWEYGNYEKVKTFGEWNRRRLQTQSETRQ
jgi:hypothetical protein